MVRIVYEPQDTRAAAYDGNREVGKCTYSESEALWIIDHTFVDDAYNGQGIAGRLVAELVDQARDAGVKIVPLCPFAVKEFDNKEEYADVRHSK
ncbi:MAG: N-acetyltransferase [Veillonellaceae bacterium]|nr:N-acetyltransferase [Veillonellaceae bacterium]